MRPRRLAPFLSLVVAAALIWPAASLANNLKLSATVSAQLKERRNVDLWTVDLTWTASCQGADAGKETWYDGNLYLVNAETGERIHAGGTPDTSGRHSITGSREWYVAAREREQHLIPELTITCYEVDPLHGGPEITVTGTAVIIPRAFSGSGGGGSGGDRDDYGSGDPTAPMGAGGCANALLGTNAAETLMGGTGGDVVFGFGGADRIWGRAGHDCLIGGSGNDRLYGERGNDRLTGGRGRDVLVGGAGVNAHDAGPGNDYVSARNRKRELVRCGRGRDQARVDRRDRVRSCERLLRR